MNIIQDKTTFLLGAKKKLILLLALTLASGVMGTSSAGAAPTTPSGALTKYVSEAQSGTWSLPSEFTPDSSTYTYAIAGGDDQSKFNIDSATGALSSKSLASMTRVAANRAVLVGPGLTAFTRMPFCRSCVASDREY